MAKIDQIGAQDKYKVKTPLEVTLNGISIVNETLVLNKWKDDFSSYIKASLLVCTVMIIQ